MQIKLVLSAFNFSLFFSKYWGRQFTLMNLPTSRLSQFLCSVIIVISSTNTNCQTPVINITNKNIRLRILPFGTPCRDQIFGRPERQDYTEIHV